MRNVQIYFVGNPKVYVMTTGTDTERLKEEIMAKVKEQFDEKVAELNRSFDAKQKVILDAVAAIRDELEQAKANAVTPEQLAPLDELDRKIDAFDPFNPATLPADSKTEPVATDS